MKKAIMLAMATILLLPAIALAQYSGGQVSLADSQELPGLVTMVSGSNTIEYKMTATNTGDVPYIAGVVLGLTGRTACDGSFSNDPVIPTSGNWLIDVADSTGNPVWDAPYEAHAGTVATKDIPVFEMQSGETVEYTVLVTSAQENVEDITTTTRCCDPQMSCDPCLSGETATTCGWSGDTYCCECSTGGNELTLHAHLIDVGTNTLINADCEDIKMVTPGGMITLEFIQVILVGSGSALAVLGMLGFFV